MTDRDKDRRKTWLLHTRPTYHQPSVSQTAMTTAMTTAHSLDPRIPSASGSRLEGSVRHDSL